MTRTPSQPSWRSSSTRTAVPTRPADRGAPDLTATTGEPPKEPPTEVRAAVLRRVAKQHTAPELLLRTALHARGLRYRLHVPVPSLPRRSIDVALTRARIAVFVDGCFWHGCPDHFHLPVHNREWWTWKLASVRARDADTTLVLRSQSWLPVRVWEHEDMDLVAGEVRALWRERTGRA